MSPPLYVTQQGAKLRIQNRCLLVEQEADGDIKNELLVRLPLGHVSQVVLLGNIGLTTPTIGALLDEGKEVTFLTKNGHFRGSLVGPLTPHVPLRRAQYRRLEDPAFVLEMAGGFVKAKLSHQRTLLQRHNREKPDDVICAAIEQMAGAIESIPRKTSLESLRGLEGSATAAYFSGYRRLFDADWKFDKRQRRPPTDPVNVLLSFGYTILAGAAGGAVQAVGLDPFAGFLHEVAYNRPALGLDLVEEFRPVVDGVVLWCCHGRQISPADFLPGDEEYPLLLSPAGKKCFLKALEQRMEQPITHPASGLKYPLRQCLLEQARQLAGRLQNGPAGYQGMGFR